MVQRRLTLELWRLTNGAVVANNRDSHYFDKEPDMDPHQSEKLRVVEANKWCHGG